MLMFTRHTFRPLVLSTFLVALAEPAFAGSTALGAAPTEAEPSLELIDPAALGFGVPAFTLDTTFQDTLDYDDGDGGFDSIELRLIAPILKWQVGQWTLGATLNYSWVHGDFGDRQQLGTKEMQTVEAQLFAAYMPDNTPWWFLGFVKPGVATDFDDVTSDSFTASALALVGYRWSPRLDIAGGVYASYTLNDATVIPALGFLWRPNDQWIVQATPPIVAIGWRPTPDWTFGVVTYPAGDGWEVGKSGDTVRQVDLSLWRAAISAERKVGAHWRFSARVGVAFGGELELRDSDDRVIEETDLDAAPFGAFAVKWSF